MSIEETQKLPAGWKWVKLGEVCELNPKRPPLDRPDSALTTFVAMPAVEERTGTISRPEIRPYGEIKKGYTYFSAGDVLFAKITPCMQNGKHAVASLLIDGIGFGSTEFHVLRPSKQIVSEWIHSYLRQPSVMDSAKAHFTGAVGQQRVPADYLASLIIPLPPLPEQKRIAAILTEKMAAVEKARAAAEARLKAAKELPAAYLREVFESEEAKEWPRHKLKDVVTKITDGTHQPPPFTREGMPFLFVRNIVSGKIDFNVEKYVSKETYEELVKRCRPERGDILYSAVGSFGVAVVVDTDQSFTFQRHIAHIKPNHDKLTPDFLASFLNSPEGRAQSNAVALGGAQRTVTLTSLSRFDVPLPSIHRQQEVVSFLKNNLQPVEMARTASTHELSAINSLPTALLRQAFSGEL